VRVRVDDGVSLEVRVEGRGPGLLLVHGFGGAKEDFDDHVELLADDHTVVTFDHRGHGASDKPADVDSYTLARLEADTLAVADAAGLDRFRLLGHSMGGMVARGLALRQPERVAALVLMDTSPGPIPGIDPAMMEAAAWLALEHGKNALREVLDDAAPLDNPAHQRVLAERPGYQEFADRKWDDLSEIMWAGLARALARQPDELADLVAIDVPTLVLVGEHDDSDIRGIGARIEADVETAELVPLSDAAHLLHLDRPERFVREVEAFLRRSFGESPPRDAGVSDRDR